MTVARRLRRDDIRIQRSVELVQNWVNSLPTSTADGGDPADLLDERGVSSSPSSSPPPHTHSLNHPLDEIRDTDKFHLPLRQRHSAECHNTTSRGTAHHPSSTRLPSESAHPKITRTKSLHPVKITTAGDTTSKSRTSLRRRDTWLSWMNSNYSSFNSETSSIEQLLDERKANPEQVLMNLGFGVYDKTIGARLPARFLSSETQASGINMQHFMMNHPELDRFVNGESKMAVGELYSRLPLNYRSSDSKDSHTSLHKSFSISSQDMCMDQAALPLTVHRGEDGQMFHSILSKSNAEQLAKQGFYSEYPSGPTEHSPIHKLSSSSSSISTHDCTIESVDTPSPIILNTSPTDYYNRNPLLNKQSSSQGSDSVFSSTESYSMDRRLRAKLEAIQEKALHDISNDDLEDGISFVNYRRRSDTDLVKSKEEPVSLEHNPEFYVDEKAKSIHHKRKAFARLKSRSFDEEKFTHALSQHLESSHLEHEEGGVDLSGLADLETSSPLISNPIIVTTTDDHVERVSPRDRVIPKQIEGLLQVINPESFDSIDSDTGTLVPSASASPYQGMSPNTSRHGSLSVIPAMESFDLEEIQSSCDNGTSADVSLPVPTSKRRRAKLQRSVSERSDSDSSGIADVDGKSSTGRRTGNNSPKNRSPKSNKATSPSMDTLIPGRPHSITSSNQTLNSVQTNISATTAQTCIQQTLSAAIRLRRSSESDLQYYSATSSPCSQHFTTRQRFDTGAQQTVKETRDTEVQTEEMLCPCCRASLTYCLTTRRDSSADWQINNDLIDHSPLLPMDSDISSYMNQSDEGGGRAAASKVNFFISSESESVSSHRYSQQYSNISPTPKQPATVDDVCNEMAQDLNVLRRLFEKYNIQKPPSPVSKSDSEIREEILSSLQVAGSVLQPHTPPTVRKSYTRSSASSHHTSSESSPSCSPLREQQFLPISVDCAPETSHTNSTGKFSSAQHGCLESPLVTRHRRGGGGAVGGSLNSSPPASSHSTPNSQSTSSIASSSLSRLSDQLKHSDMKARFEKQIADLEIQKYKVTVEMKNAEIAYWKGVAADNSDLDSSSY